MPRPSPHALLLPALLAGCAGVGSQLVVLAPAQAEVVTWQGHGYEVVEVPGGITWSEAQAAARAKGGNLVCLGSAAENRFVWSLIADRPSLWTTSLRQGQADGVGPWIGLVQVRHQAQEPAGGWRWLSGEPFTFSNWAPGKPNNLEEIEDYGHFFRVAGSSDAAQWNDFPNDGLRLTKVKARRPVAYIIEYTTPPKR
jgi:hypothetical protein